jgi:hypothetical protein
LRENAAAARLLVELAEAAYRLAIGESTKLDQASGNEKSLKLLRLRFRCQH